MDTSEKILILIATAYFLYKVVFSAINKKKKTNKSLSKQDISEGLIDSPNDDYQIPEEIKIKKTFEEIFKSEFSRYDDWPMGTNRVTFFSENYLSGVYNYYDQEELRKKLSKIKGQYEHTTLEHTVGSYPLIIIDNSSAGNLKHGIYISGNTGNNEIVFKKVSGKTLEVSVHSIEEFHYDTSSDTLKVEYHDSGIQNFEMSIGKRVGFSVTVLEDVFDEFIKRKYE